MNGQVVERPQHMLMRVAVAIHKDDIASAIESYNLMSERWFTHATPRHAFQCRNAYTSNVFMLSPAK